MKNITLDSKIMQQNLIPELEKLKQFLLESHLVKSLQALIFLQNILEYELNQHVKDKKHKRNAK